MENGTRERSTGDDDSRNGPVAPKAKKSNDAEGHKRSISGSLLGGLSFLRAAGKEAASPKLEEIPADDESSSRGSLATALRQTQGTRKRRGSLRKAAMLGTGKLLRERRNSMRASPKPTTTIVTRPHMDAADSPDDETTPRRFSYENPSLSSSSDSGFLSSEQPSISTLGLKPQESHPQSTPRGFSSPLTSPVGAYASNTSTTDDDEGLSFFRPSASSSAYTPIHLHPPGPSSSLQRRRSNRSAQQSSLTIVHTPGDLELDDEWDYSETEWWGWIILIATWLVFVVVMGSMLGVWSWAWDVGETPYAPPELEDDPTLPITGYYPALMVCTAVMAWIWVVVAWVGMKYFRHARE